MPLPTHCIYETDKPQSAYCFAKNMEHAQELADNRYLATGVEYTACTLDDFCKLSTDFWVASGPLQEISADTYNEMFECLPPMFRRDSYGFFMCELTSGTVTNQYAKINGRYYCKAADLADRSTWITLDGVAALDATKAAMIDCGQCEGTGTTQSCSMPMEQEQCPVCDGSGQIKVSE